MGSARLCVRCEEVARVWICVQCRKTLKHDELCPSTVFVALWYPCALHQGSSYGLAHPPARFSELGGTALSPRTRLPGLWLTGQDVLTCGVSGAAIAGMVTAIAIDKRVIWDNLSIVTA